MIELPATEALRYDDSLGVRLGRTISVGMMVAEAVRDQVERLHRQDIASEADFARALNLCDEFVSLATSFAAIAGELRPTS